jgi:hypothetical protein
VGLFFGLQGQSPKNRSFLGFGRRLLGILGPKSSIIGLQRLMAMRKARIWRAFLTKERKFSENKNAWLGRQVSNWQIPFGAPEYAAPFFLGDKAGVFRELIYNIDIIYQEP